MTIAFELDAITLERLSERARQHGVSDPAAYALDLIRKDCDAVDDPSAGRSPGQEAVERLARARTSGMTADELMELTRSEV